MLVICVDQRNFHRMTEHIRILLVEDDPKLGKTVQEELQSNGFETDLAYDGKVAEALFLKNEYELILLDINLPYRNGWELCKFFRQHNRNVPIIMLTALGEIQDKMDAFHAGADDYLVKPFHFNELLARIHVFMRRLNKDARMDDVLTTGDLNINITDKTVTRGGKELSLTMKEFMLLELLMRNKGRVVSKAEIAEKVWNLNFDTGTNTIEVYINFLRNKVDKPFEQALIHTKPGFGYYLKEE
jgi:two-component system copper resistance phosphate regulon response regulator CusR